MKKVILPFIFVFSIFIAGCNQANLAEQTGGSVVNTIAATSTAESTIPKEETTIFSSDPKTCPKEFLRRHIKADGSIEEFCLPPEDFRLKSCLSDQDCTAAELCISGYCRIQYED